MNRSNEFEKLLWSIAFPGFAQFLNGHILKGILLIGLEFAINQYSNMNQAIIASFHGNTGEAVRMTNYQWLMYYPCVYIFAIYDGYKGAGGGNKPYSYIPFVFAAYFGTIGVIFSSSLEIFGILWGPIWLSLLFLWMGAGIGMLVRKILMKK